MTFQEILQQVIAWLQKSQRLSYHTIKRQFNIDDACIEDLKEELIHTQKLAVDENGRTLVWNGVTETVLESVSVPPEQPSTSRETQPIRQTPSIEVHAHEAERRQLTVMFVDLVGSTSLSGALDLEDLHEVIKAYQMVCTEVVQRYDGHVAQLLGDGLLLYFGYPKAHEDDAQRAVSTGLEIVEAIGVLNNRLEREQGIRLAVRLGIHTGLVIIGEMGGGDRQEQLALGETPNLAARIQGLAEPDTIAISHATSRLIHGYFDCHSLGVYDLRGFAEPVALYRVLSESGAHSRLEAAASRGLTPLVGREPEIRLLRTCWAQAQKRTGRVVLVSGEAGLGKSRLIHEFKEHAIEQGATSIEFRCLPYHQNSMLYPVVEYLRRFLKFERREAPQAKLEKLERLMSRYRFPQADTVPLLAVLLSLPQPSASAPLNISPQKQKERTQETLVAWLLEEAEQNLVCCVWEDLHWADPSTLNLLELCLVKVPTTQLLALLTFRPEFTPAWGSYPYCSHIALNRLNQAQAEAMVQQIADGKPLPEVVMGQIVHQTDGVPLFVEEMTKAILESGHLRDVGSRYELNGPLPSSAIPMTLHDVLMARLDRLGSAKSVAQLAATIGRQFSYRLLRLVSAMDARTLQRELRELVEAKLLYQLEALPQTTYSFKHMLVQEAAYQSLLRNTRQKYHHRIAQVLAEKFPETAESQPELLARHYREAGLVEQAIPYYHQAGQRAIRRTAFAEAVNHLTHGLELLQTLPESTERDRYELDLQAALGIALQTIKGYASPEVDRAYTRARMLCQRVGDTAQLVTVLRGQRTFYSVGADYRTALELGRQMLALAEGNGDSAHQVEAHLALGITSIFLGELLQALRYLEHGLAIDHPPGQPLQTFQYIGHSRAMCLSYLARTLWLLGYAEQALKRSQEGLALAQTLANPMTLAQVQGMHTAQYQIRRDAPHTQEWAEKTMACATEYGFPYWLTHGSMLKGWALAQQGQVDVGVAQFRQGVEGYRSTGAKLGLSWFLSLLGEFYGTSGQVDKGLQVMAEALAHIDNAQERYHEAEVHRLQGMLLLLQGKSNAAETAETHFRLALDVARRQHAKAWELRTVTSLARLWWTQGRVVGAQALLSSVYGWFTEGFDTPDLQDAKRLLDELSAVA